MRPPTLSCTGTAGVLIHNKPVFSKTGTISLLSFSARGAEWWLHVHESTAVPQTDNESRDRVAPFAWTFSMFSRARCLAPAVLPAWFWGKPTVSGTENTCSKLLSGELRPARQPEHQIWRPDADAASCEMIAAAHRPPGPDKASEEEQLQQVSQYHLRGLKNEPRFQS